MFRSQRKVAIDAALAQAAAVNSSQAVIEFKLDGTIITANRNFLDAMGYSLGEIHGKHHSMFVAPTLDANIAESNQFWDRGTDRFFMRIAFQAPSAIGRDQLERALKPAIDRFEMKTALTSRERNPRIIIMVSKLDHAMLHLLYQIRVGWLRADPVAIVSNHEDSRRRSELDGIPFHHLPVTRENKAEQEERLLALVRETEADLVVLARYVQVLSDNLSSRLFEKVINIHHSFLPSFKGAKPYHQASDRGVKLIGATAHYVTAELDEGPIIEQETVRVTHAMSVDDFVAAGRDIESRVLARAVKLHLDRRVMLNGQKTVVFAD